MSAAFWTSCWATWTYLRATRFARRFRIVRVLDGILSGPTFLELAVSPVAARADCPDGKVPVDAVIWSASGETTGFILVWTHGGYLVTLERTWVTDEMPEGFPALEQLRLWDPKTNRIWDPRSV